MFLGTVTGAHAKFLNSNARSRRRQIKQGYNQARQISKSKVQKKPLIRSMKKYKKCFFFSTQLRGGTQTKNVFS